MPPADLGKLNDQFKKIAGCSIREEFQALAENLRVAAPEYYKYMFESGYPPTAWADRGGRQFTNFHVKNNNAGGKYSARHALAVHASTSSMCLRFHTWCASRATMESCGDAKVHAGRMQPDTTRARTGSQEVTLWWGLGLHMLTYWLTTT